MTRTQTILFGALTISSLVASYIPVAQAQEDPVASTTATTTPAVTATQSAAQPTDWFKRERISGRTNIGDFVVGPGVTEMTLSPGESVVREISVTNRISDERTFKLEVEDISGSADGSSALEVYGNERGPYSIKDYISFPETTVTLDQGERARIPVTISVPPDGEPGGFYGTVLVSTVRVAEQEPGAEIAPSNPIIARVGSHFFLTVEGDIEVGGQALDLSVTPSKWWYESGPIDFNLAFENTGSIHVNPYGELRVTNMLGEEVGVVELPPWFVLPNSIRNSKVSWQREFLFGRYTAVATVNRGYDESLIDTVSVSFWVLPWKLLSLIFGGAFLFFFLIRLFFRTFEFKRR